MKLLFINIKEIPTVVDLVWKLATLPIDEEEPGHVQKLIYERLVGYIK